MTNPTSQGAIVQPTIFITGTSSGLGQRTALHFARLGWNVAATLRRPEQATELAALPNVRLIRHDVADPAQTQAAVAEALAAFGHVDVVVNNAGLGAYGPLELTDEAAIDGQFAVNVRGPINVIRAFLPHFRARGRGMFINISSFMGVTTAVPMGSLYNMSKFALEGLTEGLYYELKPLGIELRLVEPGGFTGNNFAQNVQWPAASSITAYDEQTARLRQLFADPTLERNDPQDIVDIIENLATGRSQQFRTLVGNTGPQLLQMRQSLPIEQYLEQMAAATR
jgi:NAD(P)-dependent dehydrogenase (short-subunit alcohol dehydrogenase family)